MENKIILDENMQPTLNGPTYYELLGVNINSSLEEIDSNYHILKKLIECYPNGFSEEEVNKIDEAHHVLMNGVSRTFYERKLFPQDIRNIELQYKAKVDVEKMFDVLNNNYGKLVHVIFMEKSDSGQFEESKIYYDVLGDVVKYDRLVVGDQELNFLGDETAVISVIDDENNILYANKYLLDENKRTQYGADSLYEFRQLSWGYYKSRMMLEEENAKKNENVVKVKK